MKLIKQLHDNELICNIKYNKSSILSKEICLNAHNHHHKTKTVQLYEKTCLKL